MIKIFSMSNTTYNYYKDFQLLKDLKILKAYKQLLTRLNFDFLFLLKKTIPH